MKRPSIDVVLSPALMENYPVEEKTVVVIDIIRATSIVCSALANGVEHMIVMPTKDICRQKRKDGYLLVGEKDGVKIPDFDLGNSPRAYLENQYAGHKLAFSTTNGTHAMLIASQAKELLIGAFLNYTALLAYLGQQQQDVILLCAGWKDRVNIEDSLFAGKMSLMLESEYAFQATNDGATMAKCLYTNYGHNMYEAVMHSAQKERIEALGLEKDCFFCLSYDYTNVIPIWQDGLLVKKQ